MNVIRGPEIDGRRPNLVLDSLSGAPVDGVLLVLHGGRSRSTAPTRRTQLAALRMLPFATAARRRVEADGGRLAIARLQYRVRGWNGRRRDPVTDARWALDILREHYPDTSIVVLGHSMGGRTGLAVAGEPGVAGLVLLAPWIETGDPVPRLGSRPVLIVHGSGDRMTDPSASRQFAAAAKRAGATSVRYESIDGGKHAMLDHAATWHRLAADAVAAFVGAAGTGRLVARPDDAGQDGAETITAGRFT